MAEPHEWWQDAVRSVLEHPPFAGKLPVDLDGFIAECEKRWDGTDQWRRAERRYATVVASRDDYGNHNHELQARYREARAALTTAQQTIEDLTALAYVPHKCICGKAHQATGMAGTDLVMDKGAPTGPDCRPLTWKEQAEQRHQDGINRRNEAKRALAQIEELTRERDRLRGSLQLAADNTARVHNEWYDRHAAERSLITQTVKWCEEQAKLRVGFSEAEADSRARALRSCAAKLGETT